LISPERAYFLGAAYGAPILETMYRQYVVSNFATLLTGPDSDPKAESHFNLLNRRYPEKVFGLVKDAGKCDPIHAEFELTVY
jgi:phosphatidate phosphatase APP1